MLSCSEVPGSNPWCIRLLFFCFKLSRCSFLPKDAQLFSIFHDTILGYKLKIDRIGTKTKNDQFILVSSDRQLSCFRVCSPFFFWKHLSGNSDAWNSSFSPWVSKVKKCGRRKKEKHLNKKFWLLQRKVSSSGTFFLFGNFFVLLGTNFLESCFRRVC